MSRKKVVNILKGVAITGTAIGGASIIGDAKLVYAEAVEEMDHVDGTVVTGPVDSGSPAVPAQMEMEAPASGAVSEITVDTSVDGGATLLSAPAPMLTAPAPTPTETPAETPTETPTETPSETSSTPAIVPTVDYSAEPVADIADDLDEAATNLSGSLGTVDYTDSDEYNNVITEADNGISTAQDGIDYLNNQGFNNKGVSTQEDKTVAQKEKVEAQIETIANTTHELNGKNFYNKTYARGLAQDMILYKLMLDGKVTDANKGIVEMNWTEGNYEQKYLCVQYATEVDGQIEYHEEYFDYVTCDKDGNSLFQWEQGPAQVKDSEGNVIATVKQGEDCANNVSGINVVKKLVEFTEDRLFKTPKYDVNGNITGYVKATSPTDEKGQNNKPDENGDYTKWFNYEKTFTKADGTKEKVVFARYFINLLADATGHYKGEDYYTKAQFEKDVDDHSKLTATLTKLTDIIDDFKDIKNDAGSLSTNTSESLSTSAVESTSESLSASTADSLSASTSESASIVDSLSASTSESMSSSEYLSGSLSESGSLSASESASASLSASASESTSLAAITGQNATPTSTQSSASETSAVAPTSTTSSASADEIANPAPADVNNTVITPIGNTPVPLGVVVDEVEAPEDQIITPVTQQAKEITNIKDEQVAKSGQEVRAERGFWWWLIALIAGWVTARTMTKEQESRVQNK